MFGPAFRASGVSIYFCRLELKVLSRARRGSGESTHQCGATTAITALLNGTEFCSTHCSSRAKASDPSLRAPPITKATFRVRKELFRLSPSSREQPGFSCRSRDLTAITAQTICISCHNAQKPSAILQQAALTAGNKPRSDFPKNNPLFKCNKHYPHPWQGGTFAYGSPGR